jgi:hypothetical protein
MSSVFSLRVDNTVEDIDKNLIAYLTEKIAQLNRLQGVAKALDLPVVQSLGSLENVMTEIKDAPNTSRRILNFIDDSRAKTLRENISILEKLAKFEEKGNLREYQSAVQFVRECGQKLVKFGEESEDKLKKLSENINSKDFMERWPDIITVFHGIKEKYEKLYSKWHEDRNKLASDAIESLRNRPSAKKMGKEEFANSAKPLLSMICSSEKVEFDENFVCKTCRASIEELNFSIRGVAGEKEKIQDELDRKLVIKDPDAEQLVGFREEIASFKDIEKVGEKLKKVSERAIKEKKVVKVDAKVE